MAFSPFDSASETWPNSRFDEIERHLPRVGKYSQIGSQVNSRDPIKGQLNHDIAERRSKAGSENTHTRVPRGNSASILRRPERLRLRMECFLSIWSATVDQPSRQRRNSCNIKFCLPGVDTPQGKQQCLQAFFLKPTRFDPDRDGDACLSAALAVKMRASLSSG